MQHAAITRYNSFGALRWGDGAAPSDFTFTAQRLDGFGLLDYNARYYDSVIGRFVSADTVVPDFGNPQSLNRYSYVRNNPLRYTDSTGHAVDCDGGFGGCVSPGAFIYRASAAYKANAPDAKLVGVSLTTDFEIAKKIPVIGKFLDKLMDRVPLFKKFSSTRGVEWVKHDNGESDFFFFAGPVVSSKELGGGGNIAIYAGNVKNLDSIEDFPQSYVKANVTGAVGPWGATAGGTLSTNREDTGMTYVGWAGGKTLGVSSQAVNYTSVSDFSEKSRENFNQILDSTLGRIVDALWFFNNIRLTQPHRNINQIER